MQRSKRRNERFSLTHFYFYPPRRGEARVERSDLDKKRREKKKKRWLRGRRRSKYVLSAFNDYFILTGEFISGLHYRAWPAPRRRSYVLSRLSFFFLSRRGGEISVPRTEGKEEGLTCGLTEHSAPLSAKGPIFCFRYSSRILQRTSETPLSRFPRSFLNKFRSETRPSPLWLEE